MLCPSTLCPLAISRTRLPTRLLKTLLVRGTVLWFLARLMAMAMLAWVAAVVGPLVPLWTVVAASTLVFVDLHRRKELILLHNLGVSTSSAVLTGSIPALSCEVILLMLGL